MRCGWPRANIRQNRLRGSRHLAIDKQPQRRAGEEPVSAATSELSTAASSRGEAGAVSVRTDICGRPSEPGFAVTEARLQRRQLQELP